MAIFFFIRDFSRRVARNDFPESQPLPAADPVETVSFDNVPDKCLLKKRPQARRFAFQAIPARATAVARPECISIPVSKMPGFPEIRLKMLMTRTFDISATIFAKPSAIKEPCQLNATLLPRNADDRRHQ
jgi:hypothetical protein